jgi:drug/metabolite transporter (DMT)-like permease
MTISSPVPRRAASLSADQRTGLLFGIAVPLISVLAFSAARLAPAAAVDPMTLAVLRFLGAFPVVAVLWLAARRQGAVLPRWPKLLAVGLLGGPVYALVLYYGFTLGGVTVGGAVLPATLILLTLLLGRERMGWMRLSGCGLVLAGIVLLAVGRYGGDAAAVPVFAAGGAVWAVCALLARRWHLPAAGMALATVVCGLLICLPPGFAALREVPVSVLLMQMIVQGGLNAGIAVWLYGQSLHRLGAGRTALFTALIPILSAAAGWLAFSEAMSVAVLTAAMMVAAGIIIALSGR